MFRATYVPTAASMWRSLQPDLIECCDLKPPILCAKISSVLLLLFVDALAALCATSCVPAFVGALLAHAVLADHVSLCLACLMLLLILVATAFVDVLCVACLLRLLMCCLPTLAACLLSCCMMLCLSRACCVPDALVDVLCSVPCGA